MNNLLTNNRAKLMWPLLLIIVLGAILYLNSLNGQFIWDDNSLIKNNEYIRSVKYLPKIFTQDWGAGAGDAFNCYRPLVTVTFLIDYSIAKLDVRMYHLTTVFFHIVCALVVFWFIFVLFKNTFLSFLTALFFVAHPINVESAACMAARVNSMVAIFMLLSFIFYIKTVELQKIKFIILSLICCVFALLTKESAIILPVAFLIYHYLFNKKISWKLYAPFVFLTLIYIVLRTTLLKAALLKPFTIAMVAERIPGFFVAMLSYVRLLIVPFNLHADYGQKFFEFTDIRVIAGCILVILLLLCAFMFRKRNKLISFSILWFFVMLIPSSNLYPVAFYMAEHYMYLPAIGFYLLLANFFYFTFRVKKIRTLTIFLVASLLALYSLITIKQNAYWQEPISFYKKTIEYDPLNVRTYYNLGVVYADRGETNKAIESYQQAIEVDPGYSKAYYNMGKLYSRIGDIDRAIKLYQKTIEVNPVDALAYNNLGIAYEVKKDKKNAIKMYKKAIENNPEYAAAYNNLGAAYRDLGDKQRALKMYQAAINKNPNYAEAYNNRGIVFMDLREKSKAVAAFKKAIEISPDYSRAYYNLSVLYFYEKQYYLAVEYCNLAIKHGEKVNPQYIWTLKSHIK